MQTFSIYEKESGRILRVISGPGWHLLPNIGEGNDAVEGKYSDSEYYVVNGVPTAFPAKPSDFHEFDFSAKQWVDTRTLQELKDFAWNKVKAGREAEMVEPFEWNGVRFDATEKSQQRIKLYAIDAQSAIILGKPWSVEWTTADNSTVVLGATDMLAVASALTMKIAKSQASASVKRAKIDAAASDADLIDI